ARDHDVGTVGGDPRDERATVRALLPEALPRRVLLEALGEPDRVDLEAGRIRRRALERALAGVVAGAVQMKHLVTPAGELAAELGLVRVPRVVVHDEPERAASAGAHRRPRPLRGQAADQRAGQLLLGVDELA